MWGCCPCFAKTYEAPEVLELDYRHSSLVEVPADVFTFERTLERLDLGSNQISDLPPSLFHCHELRELDLCDNDLMTIPPAVGSLTRLCKLDLSRNAITDVADSIKNCKSLVYFDLSMNHLTKLPEGISQLVNLEELFLNDTYLEFLHANFGRLTKLKVLELRENAIQTLPKSMSRLHNLQRLDVGQNDLTELPEVVGTMTNLTELWCDNNNIRSLPKFMGNLSKVNCLDASQNEIQRIADEISKCTQLMDVTLSINSLESLPDSFTKLESLTVLRLDCNSIAYLPEEFGNLKNLQELSIVSNILKSLPASIGLLRKLHTLYLDDNLLSALPKEIGSCTSLSVLSAAKNRLKEIPSEIGHLFNLKVFTLAANLIVNLPVSILNIPKLGALWLSESQSKPFLQLNKEIDPESGQHVLTCYLLPQLPSTGYDIRRNPEESTAPRRPKPSIKFVTDVEPVVLEANVNKRGLLRAPTPYPKELRALAKHASHIRQSKELNGEVNNTDEPEYEGDYPEVASSSRPGGETLSNSQPKRIIQSVQNPTESVNYNSNLMPTLSTSKVDYKPPISSIETIGLPPVLPISTSVNKGLQAPSTSSVPGNSYSHSSVKDVESGKKLETSVLLSDRFSGLPDGPDKSSRETYGNSATEMARKSPPPYHVAARRAAFFRSSGGAGSGRIGSPTPDIQGHIRASPIIGRMFPLPVEAIPYHAGAPAAISSPTISSNSNIENVNDNQNDEHKEIDTNDDDIPESTNSILNSTYIVSKDIDDSDIVSSVEENLNSGSSLILDKGTLDTKNLVKTIESALESVDKRTTEFLRDDRWEDILSSDPPDPEFPDPPQTEALYSNIDPPENIIEVDQTDSIVRIRSNIPTGIPSFSSSGSYNFKGPVVPPKPSPSTRPSLDGSFHASNNNLEVGGNMNSFSKGESHTRIPTFNSSYSNKSSNSQLPMTSPSTLSKSTIEPNFLINSSVTKTEVECLTNLTGPNSLQGLSSRIPKLPSLTTSFPSSVQDASWPRNHYPSKKPEILSPKPSVPQSRIPSIGDSRSKEDFPISPIGAPASFKTSIVTPKISVSGKIGISSSGDGRNFGVNNNLFSGQPAISNMSKKSPRIVELPTPEKHELRRSGSGTKIPKFNDNSRTASPAPSHGTYTLDNSPENNNDVENSSSLSNTSTTGISKIPSFGNKKPWIFGTHKNARVVAVEFKKINSLGFTINEAPPIHPNVEGQGIYVVETDEADSSVKVGDKILQVDGIDVSNMSLDIVKKILSNCQENINLLVSRKS